jgi:hypothetical protein
MPRKFWLMPGLEFHKLRAEMPPNPYAYAWVYPVRVLWALFSTTRWD